MIKRKNNMGIGIAICIVIFAEIIIGVAINLKRYLSIGTEDYFIRMVALLLFVIPIIFAFVLLL